jgi:hypothetical protein
MTPVQLGQIFCAGRLANEMTPVRALLTPDLGKVIAAAEAKNAEIQKQHPDEKPPLGDGIPWQGAADHPPQCNPVGLTGTYDTPEVVLSYSFPDQPASDWTDNLMLKFIDGKVRIDDIKYGNGGFLRKALEDAFK